MSRIDTLIGRRLLLTKKKKDAVIKSLISDFLKLLWTSRKLIANNGAIDQSRNAGEL